MQKLIGFVGMVLLLVFWSGGTPAVAQSTPPSAIFGPTTTSPSKSLYLHILVATMPQLGIRSIVECSIS